MARGAPKLHAHSREKEAVMANVRAIPEGYHSLTPHLVIRDCARAIEFYKKAFGAEERGRAPGPDGRIMHAELKIGDSIVMLSDEYPEMGGKSPQALNGSPVTINLYTEDANAAWKRATEAGATVRMPLGDQFWGDRYGQVTDPFGHHWSIAQHIKDVSPAEMKQAMDAMARQEPQKKS